MDDDFGPPSGDEPLRGTIAGMEFLLAQLFVYTVENIDDPQSWIVRNLEDIENKLTKPDRQMSRTEKEAAWGTIARVMHMTSSILEALGKGDALNVRRTPLRPDEEA